MARVALSVAVLALLAAGASAAPPDPASLFPPDALAYVEVRQPAKTADALAGLFKDTVLADNLAFSHDRRDTLGTVEEFRGFRAVQSLGLFTSPEMLAELKRTGGVSAALLGFDPATGRPRWAVAVLLGESNALGLMARTYLTTGTNIRRVGKVGDVPVYQNRALTGGPRLKEDDLDDPPPRPKPADPHVPPEGADEPTYLYVPGLFVVGSGKAAVADVLERFKKPAKEAMAATLGKADRDRPGVFVWADLPRLEKEYVAARKRGGADLISPDLFAHLRFLLPGKSLSPAAGHLSIEPDGFALTLQATAADADAAPLLALLNGGSVDAANLRTWSGGWAGVTLALPAKEQRAKAVVRVADALAAACGDVGQTPGERLAELTAGGFKAEADLFPQLKAVTAVMAEGAPGKAKPGRPKPGPPPEERLVKPGSREPEPALPDDSPPGPSVPTLILTLESVDAAKAWEAAVPQFARWLCHTEKPPGTSSEVVGGLKVVGMVIDHDGGRQTVYFCRNGDQIAVGTDRGRVVAASSLDPAAKAPAKPDKGSDPAAFAFLRFDTVAGWIGERLSGLERPVERLPEEKFERAPGSVEETPKLKPGSVLPPIYPGSEKQDPPPPDKPKADPPTPEQVFRKALGDVPPLTAAVSLKDKTLTAAVRFKCEKKQLAALIEAWMTWAETPNVGSGTNDERPSDDTILRPDKR